MEQSLNYLGVERDYVNQIEKNLRWFLDTPTYKVENYIGKTKKEIKTSSFYNYIFYGEGDKVIYQSPDAGEKIKEGDSILLYLGWLPLKNVLRTYKLRTFFKLFIKLFLSHGKNKIRLGEFLKP